MKTIHIVLNSLIFTLFTQTACRKNHVCENGNGQIIRQELALASIERIRVNGSMYVYLKEDSIQKVSVEMESNLLDDLNRNVQDGIWKIEFNRCVNEKKRVNVYISLPNLKEANLNGSGEIYSQTDFHGSDLVLKLNGSGKINMNTFYTHLILTTNGSGNILLNGKSNSVNAEISGSGKQKLFGLEAEQATIKITGSGELELAVSKTLDVTISGSGKMRYKGSPSVTTSINGSGSVSNAD